MYSVQGLYRGTVYGVQCTIVCCGVNVAYVACLEADTSSVRLAVPARASGWRSGWRSRSSVRLAAGWGLAVPPVGSSGWRLAAGGPPSSGWLGVPLERLAVPSVWRGIVIAGLGLAIGGFWKVFSYPPYKRDFPKPPLCPSRSNKLT